jgi:hypothetical protein
MLPITLEYVHMNIMSKIEKTVENATGSGSDL